MHFERFDPATDTDRVRACFEMCEAGQPFDEPDGPPSSLPVFTGWWAEGWVICPRETWLAAREPGGSWAGAYLLELPEEENTHLGMLSMIVPPGQRRSGVGTALLRHAAQRAAASGRTLLEGNGREDSPGEAFAGAVGARPGVPDIIRRQELDELPPGRLAELRQQAAGASGGYSVVSWSGPCPEEYLDQLATVVNAFEDAPHNPGWEPERFDGRRLRLDEERSARQGLRTYTVAARHESSGELAGVTAVGVDPAHPDWGFQELTAVTRAHRGHKLGLLVKVAMLDLLAEAEPGLKRIHTGNADSNRHMIAVNEALGYRVAYRWLSWQLNVAHVLGHSTPPAPARATAG